MCRRLFVALLVAALTPAVAPRPASGLDGGEVRPRLDDHFRCMYRCADRPDSNAVRPTWHRGDGWNRPGGSSRWDRGLRPGWWDRRDGRDRRGWRDRRDWWDRPGRANRWDHRERPGWRGWHRWDRWHRADRWPSSERWDRGHDPSRDSGYDAHRHHPRGRDF